MHLESLTLRGFKSFASSTTLRFEPGITVVVGPNGSGQVQRRRRDRLGARRAGREVAARRQDGRRHLRRHGRPPGARPGRGRADDRQHRRRAADRLQPRSRSRGRCSATAGRDYAINGSPCRLLDVQELLSDSGIGREMHVIVGQGQLDAILHAAPEERRGFIEEAAGVLKHRKRKEKALRKLEAMQANLNRLQDLTNELRRQLKPLGQQADVARRAERDPGRPARLPGCGCSPRTCRCSGPRSTPRSPTRPRCSNARAKVEADLAEAARREADLDAALAAQTPRLARAQETWYRLAGLRERLRGTASLAAERQRTRAIAVDLEVAGRDPQAHGRPRSTRSGSTSGRRAGAWSTTGAGSPRPRSSGPGSRSCWPRRTERSARRPPGSLGPSRGSGPAAGRGQRAAHPRGRSRRRDRSADRCLGGGQRPGRPPRQAEFAAWRARSPASTPARSTSMPATRRGRRRWPRPRRTSPRCRPRSTRSSGSAARRRLAATRWASV